MSCEIVNSDVTKLCKYGLFHILPVFRCLFICLYDAYLYVYMFLCVIKVLSDIITLGYSSA